MWLLAHSPPAPVAGALLMTQFTNELCVKLLRQNSRYKINVHTFVILNNIKPLIKSIIIIL